MSFPVEIQKTHFPSKFYQNLKKVGFYQNPKTPAKTGKHVLSQKPENCVFSLKPKTEFLANTGKIALSRKNCKLYVFAKLKKKISHQYSQNHISTKMQNNLFEYPLYTK